MSTKTKSLRFPCDCSCPSDAIYTNRCQICGHYVGPIEVRVLV